MTVTRTPPATLTGLLFEKVSVGLCLVAPDGTVVRVNEEWLRSTGYTEEQVVGENIIDLFPMTRDMALAMHARARAGHRVEVPRHAQRVNGRETWWEGCVEPVPMDGGNGLLITAREIASPTPPGGSEPDANATLDDPARLRESEAWFRLLSEAMPQIVCVVAPDGTIEYVNRTWIAFSGKSLRDTSEAGWKGIVHPDDFAAARECLRRTMSLSTPQEVELRYRAGDGGYRWFLSRLAPLVENGRVIRLVGAAMEIDDRKRVEEALREREAELHVAQRIAHVGSWSWTVGTDWLDASEEVFRIYGRDPSSPIPLNDSEELRRHYTPEGWTRRREAFRKALADGAPWERDEQIVRLDGTIRWVHFRGEVERDAAGQAVKLRGTVEDITERKRVEDALRETEKRYRTMGETLPYGVWLCNAHGGAEYVSQSFLNLLEMTQEEMREFGWTHRLPPEEVQPMLDKWLECVKTGTPWDSEHRVLGPDGKYHHVLTRGLPVRDEDGNITCWVGINLDIDERKKMEQDLRDADRRKDEFLGMLSHELRNPLAPVRNSIYILRLAEPGGEQAQRAQAVIERQVEHITRLVDDLLDVTRIARGKIELRRTRVDLREVVWRATEDFRLVLHDRGVRFEVVVPDEKLWAHADATRITQIVGNLLHNASKFTRKGDEVMLSLEHGASDATIRVRDTGAGIAPELLPRIFEAFVQGERTLARTDGGLGLGLALVKGIAEMHGGTVRATSAGNGMGSEFTVRLPLLPSIHSDAHPEARPERRGHSRRVLIVDDNADAAESLADLVRMLGHTAEVAYDGPSAIEKVRASPPNVVLCDIGLPGMSGYEVAKALRASALEGVQLIAVSGYAQPEDVKRAIEAGFDGHVAKPCDPEKIGRLLR